MFKYMCFAEDPRKTPQESWIGKHAGPHSSKFEPPATAEDTAAVIWCRRLHFKPQGLLPALAYRLRVAPLGGRPPGAGATGWPPIQKIQFRLHRARFAEDPCGSQTFATATGEDFLHPSNTFVYTCRYATLCVTFCVSVMLVCLLGRAGYIHVGRQ
jgi:hypothetical protein